MKKIIFLFFLMIGCTSVADKSCEFCGEWTYDRFEYAGHVTTDCERIAKTFYTNSTIKLDVNEFSKTYDIDNSPKQLDNVDIKMKEMEEPGIYELIIKKDDRIIDNFYIMPRDVLYKSIDGCYFYFKRI